jgi:hypothetical protein
VHSFPSGAYWPRWNIDSHIGPLQLGSA